MGAGKWSYVDDTFGKSVLRIGGIHLQDSQAIRSDLELWIDPGAYRTRLFDVLEQ
jgi:hypothetical protein